MKLILSILLIAMAYARDVTLSAGIGGYNHSALWSQYTTYKAYSDMKMISTASILAYYIATDGSLAAYQTGDPTWTAEQYQQSMTTNLGLKSMPCLYCDATIGNCQNLSQRLDNLYANEAAFITDSLNRASTYKYDGFLLDLEPDSSVDPTKLTDFVLNWGGTLQDYNLTLVLWIGGDTPYDNNRIFNTTLVKLVTMNTYDNDYETFINNAASLQTSMDDVTRLGFGLLTNYGMNKFTNVDVKDNATDISGIVDWAILSKAGSLSLWASHIPPEWYGPLIQFYNAV